VGETIRKQSATVEIRIHWEILGVAGLAGTLGDFLAEPGLFEADLGFFHF
jgi:hypothetical protein